MGVPIEKDKIDVKLGSDEIERDEAATATVIEVSVIFNIDMWNRRVLTRNLYDRCLAMPIGPTRSI